jgi:hypothetical protein
MNSLYTGYLDWYLASLSTTLDTTLRWKPNLVGRSLVLVRRLLPLANVAAANLGGVAIGELGDT